MRYCSIIAAILFGASVGAAWGGEQAQHRGLPAVSSGWAIELTAEAPAILYPTAICAATDGALYLGSDPMDMPGPPTVPIDRVLRIKDGKIATFAEKLWSVMGIECVDGTVYVVHAPYLSAFRDNDGDGRADSRIDLVTGLGPALPGFSGINDHVASGIRLAMDGYLYIAVGDKGLPRAEGRDGSVVKLFGGGVVRVRPDGTGLEVVSTGERNPLSVAISASDELFSYGNDDDSKKWPNSLTHHIVGGHYGYPYQFLNAPDRALPVMHGLLGGSGAQGVCYNEDGLPEAYRGNLFFCDWGLQSVIRFEIRKAGGTHAVTRRTELVTQGGVQDFRPFSIAVSSDGGSFWLVDWAFSGWLASGPRTGRLFRVHYTGSDRVTPAPRPTTTEVGDRIKALNHPARSVRMESQRMLVAAGRGAVGPLRAILNSSEPESGRVHALWALDAVGGEEARVAIRALIGDGSPRIRLQAARSTGIRRDVSALGGLVGLLKDRDPAVRREAAIALGRLGQKAAGPALYEALNESDPFAAWSVRRAIRQIDAWDKSAIAAALLDEGRRESALRLTDEAWAVPAVEALSEALARTDSAIIRSRMVSNIAGMYRRYPEWSGYWFGTNPLRGRFPEKTRDWTTEGMTLVLKALVAALGDRDASVRHLAISGLAAAGKVTTPVLRVAIARETDATNLISLAESLGKLGDALAGPVLSNLAADSGRPEAVRIAAVDALKACRDPESLRTRFALIYDPMTPAAIVSRALPELARAGTLPANDLAGFFEHSAASVRASALLSINVKKPLSSEIKRAVLDRLDDRDAEVRLAAIAAVGPLKLEDATPQLLSIAEKTGTIERERAILALCEMPDKRSIAAYLAAIEGQDLAVQSAGERALKALGSEASETLMALAGSRQFSASAVGSLNRILGRFEPIREWRVIGPFPRTTPRVFVGEKSIDFGRAAVGAGGESIEWITRLADPATGRVDLEDFKRGSGDAGGFGYDVNGSPDLCSFAYTEIESAADRNALVLVGSSGTLVLTVNEVMVHVYRNLDGRAYSPESDMVKVKLVKGKNRVLVQSRQGIGRWAFGMQVGQNALVIEEAVKSRSVEGASNLGRFASRLEGDPRRGEEIFFDPKGVGCGRCHSAGGRGTATIGPDLTGLATKYDREELIRSVLEPSKRIATGYQTVNLATTEGKVVAGVIRSESVDALELATAEGAVVRVSKREIEDRRPSQTSIMAAGLTDALSAVEFADLVSYLSSLKQQSGPVSAAVR